ncbi:MAG: type II toxin-antitoxin system VapC family toxin [Deltaproteobacteria bacterium]|nr:type II toxin-antitoxin system VapC family toxin [Deltaproteobacteria bacterium]
MTVYLDTSTVLRVVLGQPGRLSSWAEWETACASELLSVEARRVLDRLRLEGALDDDQVGAFHRALGRIVRTIDCIRVTRLVLGRAALPMATPVKTLDALHLASALLWRERHDAELVFATHDPQQARAARALGFECVGV